MVGFVSGREKLALCGERPDASDELTDQVCLLRVLGPVRARPGPPKARGRALVPGSGGAQRSRLDSSTAQFGNAPREHAFGDRRSERTDGSRCWTLGADRAVVSNARKPDRWPLRPEGSMTCPCARLPEL